MKVILKKIKILRRLYDAYIASRYFNNKYIEIIKWMFNSNENTNYTYDLDEQNLNELYKLLEHIFDVDFIKIKSFSEELLKNDTLKKYLKSKIESSNFKNYLIEKKSNIEGLENILFTSNVEEKLYGNLYGRPTEK